MLGDHPVFARSAYLFFLLCTPLSMWWFSRSFLDLGRNFPRLDRLLALAPGLYVLGWTGLLLAGVVWALAKGGLVSGSRVTENGMQIGSAFEVFMLSLALGDRYRTMKEEKERTQEQALTAKTRLLASMSRFVPNEFLQQLGRTSVQDVQLAEAVQRDMTIMFSDIRSFTALSETMTPSGNFQFLNALYRRIGPIR